MRRIACGAAVLLAVASATAVAQGVQPGGPVYNSTGTGSGLGGVIGGTGPTWPNGTNPAPQPVIPSVPPGGYPSPAPPSTYTPSPTGPRSTYIAPSVRPSPYPRPNEPFATSTPRPPATIPLQLPQQPNGSLGFAKGCWRSDNFAYAGHRGTVTWCFDDRGGGRYLYTRTDAPNVFFCHAQAEARWDGPELHLSGRTPACDGGGSDAPAELVCHDGTDGALCSDLAKSWTVRLYRVR